MENNTIKMGIVYEPNLKGNFAFNPGHLLKGSFLHTSYLLFKINNTLNIFKGTVMVSLQKPTHIECN